MPFTYLAQAHSSKDIKGVIKTNVEEDSGDNLALNDEVNNDNFDKKDIKPVEKENDSPSSNFEGRQVQQHIRLCLRGGFNQDYFLKLDCIF